MQTSVLKFRRLTAESTPFIAPPLLQRDVAVWQSKVYSETQRARVPYLFGIYTMPQDVLDSVFDPPADIHSMATSAPANRVETCGQQSKCGATPQAR